MSSCRASRMHMDGFDARGVANAVLDVSDSEGTKVTHLSLQKILYFCHGWHLARTGLPLIKQRFEAWKFGPVLQCVYQELKQLGDSPITSRLTALDRISGKRVVAAIELLHEQEALIRNVVSFYGRLPAHELVNISHRAGSPWDQTINHNHVVNPGMYIDNHAIRAYFMRESSKGLRN